jgi:hypothetical protein
MIKLIDLLNELEKPEQIYAPGQDPETAIADDELMKRGFKLGKPEINPETGTSSSTVIYLPNFEQIRRQILSMRKEFQPFKFSSNADIAKVSKDINTNMTKLSQLIFALDKMIELQKK